MLLRERHKRQENGPDQQEPLSVVNVVSISYATVVCQIGSKVSQGNSIEVTVRGYNVYPNCAIINKSQKS